ncbi:uncharacterized protein BP01DRAFT_366637 [Aspergillus saccharolyticus JOP 1030-1]|uniref:Uncharacterized protein n=1 Tax=Aspergillus saccharolyticus JOP 1030-1 TaxID=1450539 RepID=A0A318Z9Z1_9EURO|nr:hypothetical protein BP01DRAFT_366637 [Aspergillus saccharolyticus JOP 1030-1]PYH44196.1 hypothetical protein BP01DRAFT_366637 [Aspergillus saccharolyticus JOP 1030-1]
MLPEDLKSPAKLMRSYEWDAITCLFGNLHSLGGDIEGQVSNPSLMSQLLSSPVASECRRDQCSSYPWDHANNFFPTPSGTWENYGKSSSLPAPTITFVRHRAHIAVQLTTMKPFGFLFHWTGTQSLSGRKQMWICDPIVRPVLHDRRCRESVPRKAGAPSNDACFCSQRRPTSSSNAKLPTLPSNASPLESSSRVAKAPRTDKGKKKRSRKEQESSSLSKDTLQDAFLAPPNGQKNTEKTPVLRLTMTNIVAAPAIPGPIIPGPPAPPAGTPRADWDQPAPHVRANDDSRVGCLPLRRAASRGLAAPPHIPASVLREFFMPPRLGPVVSTIFPIFFWGEIMQSI